MSYHLTGAGIDHVLIERGEVGQSWRTERWDSLRLLTPNWMTALSGARYEGDDPDGYMTAGDTVAMLEAYSRSLQPTTAHGTRGRSDVSHRRRVRSSHDKHDLELRCSRRRHRRLE